MGTRVLLHSLPGWVALAFLALVTACGRVTTSPLPTTIPVTPVRTSTPVPSTDEEAILQLLQAEAEGVVQGDIVRLMDLWAEEGVVTDARHTPDDASDDLIWQGRDAIRQRYVNLVFPGNPTVAGHPEAQLVIKGDLAVVTTTTAIGPERAVAGDRWTFIRRDGRWWIANLTYNLEAKEIP